MCKRGTSSTNIAINVLNDEKLCVFKLQGQQGKFPMTNKDTKKSIMYKDHNPWNKKGYARDAK